MELFIPFYTLVELVDAEDSINGKTHTLHLPMENFNVTSNLESQFLSDTYNTNLKECSYKQLI